MDLPCDGGDGRFLVHGLGDDPDLDAGAEPLGKPFVALRPTVQCPPSGAPHHNGLGE
jgi:hypothetical protein